MGEVTLRAGTLADMQWTACGSDCYRIALEFARKEKDPFLEASALGSLGLVATQMERYDESVDWNRKALPTRTSRSRHESGGEDRGQYRMELLLSGGPRECRGRKSCRGKDATTAGLHQTRFSP